MKRSLPGLLVLSLLTLTPTFAQDATGRIVGTATDVSGSVVPGVRVTVVNTKTGVRSQTTTSDDGSYQVPLLPIGTYEVTAEKEGFRKLMSEPQALSINQNLRFDLKLEVGATTEVVQVEALASGVETVNATLSQTVSGAQIQSLPLNGRNVLDLAFLQPGVTPSRPGLTGSLNINISGGRGDSVTFVLDGGMNNNLLNNGVVLNPNPDAIAEFKILTSNYTAEYGRNAGGIISVVTKSGTNQMHGSAYDFLRNDAFNANLYFNNKTNQPRPVLKRNQFGGTLGGPIKKDRLFYFFGYQGQRQKQAVANPAVQVFTPAELRGDFSLSNAARTGPDQGVVAFLNDNPYFQSNPTLRARGIIDSARFDPVATKYIAAGLIPTDPSGQLFPRAGASTDVDEYTPKVDFIINDSNRISSTIGYSKSPTLTPFHAEANVPGWAVRGQVVKKFLNLSWVSTPTSTFINEFRATAQRNDGLQSDPAVTKPKPTELGINIISDNPTGPTQLWFNNGLRLGFSRGGPTRLVDNTYIYSDTMTWIKGRHSFKSGFTFNAYQNNTKYDFYINGAFFFSGSPDNGGIGSGNEFADFLLGAPDEYLQFPSAPSNIRSKYYSAFAQDEWRVSKNLVLTLGLRYEYSSPKFDTRGRSFSLALGQQSSVFTKAPLGLLFPGDANAPKGSNFPDKNDFQPRFGFAYSPGSKTSIRGGFGVFADILKAEDNLQYNGQAPFFGFADLFFDPPGGGATRAFNLMSNPFVAAGQPNPFPSKPPAKDLNFGDAGFLPFGGGGVYFVDPKLRTPYVFQYNLSIQRELARNLTVNAAYVGTSSRKLTGLTDANPFVLGTTRRLFNAQNSSTSSSFSYMDEFRNLGRANYNSLQLGITQQSREIPVLGRIEFMQLSYTWQKSMDTLSGFRERNGSVPYYNPNQFRAPSDFDVTQNLVMSAGWELPFNKFGGPKALLGGWVLYPILTMHTGFPLDVFAGISRSRTRTGPSAAGDPQNVRADLIAAGVGLFDPHQEQTIANRKGNFYFDRTAFSTARFSAAGFDPVNNASQRTYGTLQRNAFRGPGRVNFDLALAKEFPIWKERVGGQFRVETFNLPNNAQWGTPNTTFTSAQFGQVTSTLPPRIMQMALRIRF